MLEGVNPNARHHGKGLERVTFCHGVELSYCLVTVKSSHRNRFKDIPEKEKHAFITFDVCDI